MKREKKEYQSDEEREGMSEKGNLHQ